MGQDKGSIASESKLHMKAKQNEEFIQYFCWAGRYLASSWEAGPLYTYITGTWEDKCSISEGVISLFLLLSLSFFCYVQCHMAWGIPLICWVQLSQLCPHRTSCPAPSLLTAGQSRKTTRPWCCEKTCSAIRKALVCYQPQLWGKTYDEIILMAILHAESIAASCNFRYC